MSLNDRFIRRWSTGIQTHSRPGIHSYLLNRIIGIVCLAFLIFSVATYFFVSRPAQEELASLAMVRASDQVAHDVGKLFGTAVEQLNVMHEWAHGALLDTEAPHSFAKLLIPILKTQRQVAGAIFADGQGRYIELNPESQQGNRWIVRVANIPRDGALQHWYHYDEDGRLLSEERIDRLYDARTRPWYQQALAAPANEVHWTKPYTFFGRQDIGITATLRSEGLSTKDTWVVALDVLMLDLTRFVSQLKVGESGSAALLTSDAKLLSPPRFHGASDVAEPSNWLYKRSEEVDAKELTAALSSWNSRSHSPNASVFFRIDTQLWIAKFRELAFGELHLQVVTLGPTSDFTLTSSWHAPIMVLLVLLTLGLAFAVALRFSRSFASMVDHLVAESERIGNLQLEKPVQLATHTREIDKLVMAQERMRVMLLESTRQIKQTQDVTIVAMASLAEARDNETGNHIRRTQHYVRLLAEALQVHPRFSDFLNEEVIELLFKSAPLHDIGKVGIPDSILLKPGKLTYEEFEVMKTHTTLGRDAIAKAEKLMGPSSFLQVASEIAYSHQEKWDGSGYPQGLTGDNIPVSARLMALADVYDALISRRVYKPPFPHEEAVRIVKEGSGTHFDPDIVDAFLAIQESFHIVAKQFADDVDD